MKDPHPNLLPGADYVSSANGAISMEAPGATPRDFRLHHESALKARLNEFVSHASESRFQR